MVIAVETAVHTVIFTVVGDVQRCKQVYRVAKMFAGLDPGFLCHLLQERLSGRGEQSLEILDRTGVVIQSSPNIPRGILGVIVAFHLGHDLTADIGFNDFHSRHVLHMIPAAGRVCFQPMLFLQSRR